MGDIMEKPVVSVIIPAYNCASTIPQAIDSALAQDVSLEVIVINDCSPESLDAVASQYQDCPQVVFMKNETNLGAAGSRNRGVAAARGKYVAFLDADDYWTEGKLSRQISAMERTGAVMSCTARELMTPAGELTGRILPVKDSITYRELLKHNSISCSSVVINAAVARKFPMHHDDSHEDYIMWLEVLRKYGTAVGINEPMLKYRLSNTGKSGNKLHSARMTFRVYRYMGFGYLKSVACFCSYAFHGVKKYFFS